MDRDYNSFLRLPSLGVDHLVLEIDISPKEPRSVAKSETCKEAYKDQASPFAVGRGRFLCFGMCGKLDRGCDQLLHHLRSENVSPKVSFLFEAFYSFGDVCLHVTLDSSEVEGDAKVFHLGVYRSRNLSGRMLRIAERNDVVDRQQGQTHFGARPKKLAEPFDCSLVGGVGGLALHFFDR